MMRQVEVEQGHGASFPFALGGRGLILLRTLCWAKFGSLELTNHEAGHIIFAIFPWLAAAHPATARFGTSSNSPNQQLLKARVIRDLAHLRENYLTVISPANAQLLPPHHIFHQKISALPSIAASKDSQSLASNSYPFSHISTSKSIKNDWRRQVRWQGQRFQERAIVSFPRLRQ